MSRQILKAEEVAVILRVDRQRVYDLARTNRIPAIRIGDRQYRFDLEAIDKWLSEGGTGKHKIAASGGKQI